MLSSRLTFAALAVAAAAIAATPAQAATITIGSPLSADFSKITILNLTGPETVANITLSEPGALVSSPVEGTIVRWRVLDTTGGPYRLRVLERHPDGTYTGVSTSDPQMSPTTDLQTFPTNLPIKAGQTIGIDNTHDLETDKLAAIESAAGGLAIWNPALAGGTTRAPKVFEGEIEGEVIGTEVAFNADVIPRPAVELITPVSGSTSGGTAVAVAGHDLGGATAVKFGGATASFSQVSEGLITAIAPPAASGPVDVTVKTPAGTSATVAADRFTYVAEQVAHCIVPRVIGKKLKAVRKALAAAGCKLGKVRGKGKKVVKQSQKPGLVLDHGGEVGVKLGPLHRHRAAQGTSPP